MIKAIRANYALDWTGIHGIAHWARVYENGMRVGQMTGARMDVVRLFAVFHDSGRLNDGHDPNHGRRGADLARRLRDRFLQLADEDFELLTFACAHHTSGTKTEDPTVQTCWDADRLDLGRVGIIPNPRRLCTAAARNPDILRWAYRRSLSPAVPDLVAVDWNS